ncbi:MAG: S8 family serine peptidase, partial [Gammaproteobacteria bacterium]
MPKVYYGTKDEPAFELEQSDDLIAVRTRSGRSITRGAGPVPSPLSAELDDGTLVAAYPEAGVELYRVPVGRDERSLANRKTALRASSDVSFAGGVLVDPGTNEPVLYTENLFIKFIDSADPDDCLAVLREAGLTVKYEVDYATNAYFVQAPQGSGQTVFDIAAALLKRDDVEYCHPELIRPRARKGVFPQQWHLKKTTVGGVAVDAHANVEAAHEITRGEGVTIAIIDDGVDIDHVEFSGAGKVAAPRDATLQTNDPRPKDPFGTGPEDGENHGTACAGVACANGTNGASGVAPKARLIPIRLASGLGSQRESQAFKWAADNGADVISCSWGP